MMYAITFDSLLAQIRQWRNFERTPSHPRALVAKVVSYTDVGQVMYEIPLRRGESRRA